MEHSTYIWGKEAMHDILHLIGVCPDAATHPDLLDFLLLQKDDYANQLTVLYNGFRRKISSICQYICKCC